MTKVRITGMITHLSLSHKTNNCSFTSVHLNYLSSGEVLQAKKKNDLDSRQMILNGGGEKVY